jgi:hypothetical protein
MDFGKNIPPNPKPPRRPRVSAETWLKQNDPEYRKRKRAEAQKRRKAARQATANPALIAHYKKAMHI